MIIVIISEWFSEKMGYAENNLPEALSKLASQVHLVTSDMQVYGTNTELYKNTNESFLGPAKVPTGEKKLNGYTLHRLSHYRTRYGIGLMHLRDKLEALRPDIVYLFEINMESTLQAVTYQSQLGYSIFIESRLHLSVYNPPNNLFRKLIHFFSVKGDFK